MYMYLLQAKHHFPITVCCSSIVEQFGGLCEKCLFKSFTFYEFIIGLKMRQCHLKNYFTGGKKDQNFKQLKFSIFHNAATFLPQMS